MNNINKIPEEVSYIPPFEGNVSLQNEGDTLLQDLVVNDTLAHLMPPLSPMEEMLLEKSIDEIGCQESIKVFQFNAQYVIVDGHNRYRICKKLNKPFKVEEMEFDGIEQARMWLIENQLGRRNVTPFVKCEQVIKLEPELREEAEKRRREKISAWQQAQIKKNGETVQNSAPSIKTRDILSQMVGVSYDTLTKAKWLIENAAERTKEDLRTGKLSIHRAYIVTKWLKENANDFVLHRVKKGEIGIEEAYKEVDDELMRERAAASWGDRSAIKSGKGQMRRAGKDIPDNIVPFPNRFNWAQQGGGLEPRADSTEMGKDIPDNIVPFPNRFNNPQPMAGGMGIKRGLESLVDMEYLLEPESVEDIENDVDAAMDDRIDEPEKTFTSPFDIPFEQRPINLERSTDSRSTVRHRDTNNTTFIPWQESSRQEHADREPGKTDENGDTVICDPEYTFDRITKYSGIPILDHPIEVPTDRQNPYQGPRDFLYVQGQVHFAFKNMLKELKIGLDWISSDDRKRIPELREMFRNTAAQVEQMMKNIEEDQNG